MQEIWKTIEGYPGYEISNTGYIRSFWKRKSLGHGKGCTFILQKSYSILSGSYDKNNYHQVSLYKDGKRFYFKTHMLVLTTFLGTRPIGLQACHGPNGIFDNSIDNLTWGTAQKNQRDDHRRDGTDTRGENNGSAILTEQNIQEIRKRFQLKESDESIARDYGVCTHHIARIRQGKIWRWLKSEIQP